MSLSAAAIRLMADKGLSAVEIAEIAEANEPTRSSAAVRQQRYRARIAAERNERDVTRDVTQPPSLDGPFPQTPYPLNPNPENITPLTPHGGRSPVLDLQIAQAALGALIAGIEHLAANTLTPDHVLEAWNDLAARHGLAKAKMNDRRRKAALARIRQHSVEDFTEAIACLSRNPWMHGDNDRGWRADFDFFLQQKSFTRLVEGSYDRTNSH